MTEGGSNMGPEIRPERIVGADDEKWASWLVEKKEDWESIGNPQLKLEIRLLARRGDNTVREDVLLKAHDRIEDWVRQGTISIEEAALWLNNIEKRHFELSQTAPEGVKEKIDPLERIVRATETTAKKVSGDTAEELPDSEEEQRNIIIKLVEQIETSDLPVAPIPNAYTLVDRQVWSRLEGFLAADNIKETVRREAVARIRLQHCYAIASAIPPSSKLAKDVLLGAFLQPESRRWALEGEDFETLFKKDLGGLKIGDAYMLLEGAHARGIEVNGKTIRLSDKGVTTENRDMVDNRLIVELGGGKDAKRSLKLAKRLAKVTFETSVWNNERQGSDPFAEAIYFKEYRTSRLGTVRDRGPNITINRINGFGLAFFRGARLVGGDNENEENGNERETYLYTDPDKPFDPKSLTSKPSEERISAMFDRTRRGSIDVKKLNYLQLQPGSFARWLSVEVPRVLELKELLLRTTWEPKDFTSDTIEGYVSSTDTADTKYQILRLRSELILGALHSIYSRKREAANLGWDSVSKAAALTNLDRQFIWDKKEDKEGKKSVERVIQPAFLSPGPDGQLTWVLETLKRDYHLDIHHVSAAIGVTQALTRRLGGGR